MSSHCVPCERNFNNDEALFQHKRDSPAHKFDCITCNRHFGSGTALAQHMRDAPVHLQQQLLGLSTRAQSFKCGSCDRSFGSQEALDQHVRFSPAHVPSLKPPTVPTAPLAKPIPRQRPSTKPESIPKAKPIPKSKPIPASSPVPKLVPVPKSQPIEKWSMYPSLHDAVSDLLLQDNIFFEFYEKDDYSDCVDDHDTNIMGHFICCNSACGALWTTKKMAISIRRYANNRYNARVYHQYCKRCETAGSPHLDEESYVERVSYRIKRWCGVDMKPPPFGEIKGPPHRSDLCEGCKQGHCSFLRYGF